MLNSIIDLTSFSVRGIARPERTVYLPLQPLTTFSSNNFYTIDQVNSLFLLQKDADKFLTTDDKGNITIDGTVTSGADAVNDKELPNLGQVKTLISKSGVGGGEPGKDGVSITDAKINSDGDLVLTFSEGDPKNVGKVVGQTPHIGTDGDWHIGDEDTGVPSTGPQGKSAYQIWLENGNSGGSVTDFFESLKGADGETPYIGENGNWFTDDGDTGKPSRGPQGPDGKSAYQTWLDVGHQGDEAAFLNWLKAAVGAAEYREVLSDDESYWNQVNDGGNTEYEIRWNSDDVILCVLNSERKNIIVEQRTEGTYTYINVGAERDERYYIGVLKGNDESSSLGLWAGGANGFIDFNMYDGTDTIKDFRTIRMIYGKLDDMKSQHVEVTFPGSDKIQVLYSIVATQEIYGSVADGHANGFAISNPRPTGFDFHIAKAQASGIRYIAVVRLKDKYETQGG